ncbi:hypothetical protein BRARA_F02883 [Brassica rapa]|uniref:Uncharacterized protein n=1 Tax=Brassica campestris TaxID=3711 RepID=A0A397Z1W9_BRACM|nr:hypothetical protein BRARA_F02883 [Brassica rapa]
MLRSRTNPLFCLKKEQSNIERERDSGRCSISEIKTIIIIHHQTKTVFNHLTKPSTFQLIPFFKNQNLCWVAVLSLTCWIFCL